MKKTFLKAFCDWFDRDIYDQKRIDAHPNKIKVLRSLPFIGIHLGCLLVFVVGFSTTAILTALFLYALRVFVITGFFHRYFSHRTFTCNRFWQFVFAFIGGLSIQRGALWWCAHHRHHHQQSDTVDDVHSPKHHGFWWSHVLWILANKNYTTRYKLIKDWQKYPELVWLNRFDIVPVVLLGVTLFLIGALLAKVAPQLHTNGWQLFVWGFFISTVVVYHVTFCINSLTHTWGKRRYNTTDTSRNNWIIAIFTFGEGWHNNHHHYPVATRQGFFWYEIDITYYCLLLLSYVGIIKDLKKPPKQVLANNRINNRS